VNINDVPDTKGQSHIVQRRAYNFLTRMSKFCVSAFSKTVPSNDLIFNSYSFRPYLNVLYFTVLTTVLPQDVVLTSL